MDPSAWLMLLQTVILLFTGMVVAWYTWETKRLREAAQQQLELQSRPFLVLSPKTKEFTLENVGNGPALNVQICDVLMRRDEFEVKIHFPESVPLIRAGERVPVRAESSVNGSPFNDFFTAHLDPQFATQVLDIRIEYDNLALDRYSVIQTTSPGHQSIVKFTGPYGREVRPTRA